MYITSDLEKHFITHFADNSITITITITITVLLFGIKYHFICCLIEGKYVESPEKIENHGKSVVWGLRSIII